MSKNAEKEEQAAGKETVKQMARWKENWVKRMP